MPISINTYEAIKSYLDVRLRSSDGLQNLANLPQNLRKNYRFWQQQDSEIKTLLQITDLSRSSDSQKLKNKILETFQAYKIYFEAKFQDNSDIEKILTSFTDQGNFFKSIAPSEAEYANIVELMRGLNSYLLNLILPLTEKDLEESKKEEIKRLILSSLIEFPGKNGDNQFACIAGTRERISLASLASSNLLLHQQVIAEQLEEKSTRLSPNIYIGNRAHLPSSLLYSLSFLTDEDAEKLDQHYKVPQCDTSLFDVIEMLKRFKSESKLILEKRIQDIIDEHKRLLEKLSKLEEIPAKTTKLRETIEKLSAEIGDQDKITLLENIKSNIDISFLKSLADLFPAEINFRELERLLELQSGNHYGQGQIRQVTEKLESILQKFSKLTEDQYKLRLLSDFQQKVQMEIDRDLLESTYDFFPTKKEEENDDDYGYGYEISSEKLKPSEELKLYFEEHLHKKYPQLYFLGDQGSECFKYLGDLDLFYDQGCTNLLDPKKISNLLSLFETIALSDSAGDIKIKKDKITAGILVLKNLCQNFKDSNDIYLLVFFDEFRKTKKTSFDIFFRNIFSSNPDLSRLLSPIFESIKTKRESLSSSYRGNELNILKQIFLCKKREFQFQEQRGQQQINIESLKFNVNQKFGHQQRNIFYFLVMNGQVGLISKIIDEKLDLFFAEDNIRSSPFDYAIKSNNLKVLEIIFDKIFSNRESIPLLAHLGTGSLSLASTYGHPKITEFLIRKYLEKESFNLLNQRLTANSPLIIAIDKGFDEVAKILIRYNLGQQDLNEVDQSSALHLAIKYNNTEIAKLLISKYSNLINLRDNQGNTPLHLASKEGNVKVVKELLDRGAGVDIKNTNGDTALILASEKGHVEVVRLLLERGVRVDIQNYDFDTALILASEKGHVEVVRLLLERGVRVDIQNCDLDTALILASEKGHVDVVKLLLERGARVDIQSNIGNTALILASKKGHVEVVKALLIAGANIEITNNSRRTALDIATRYERTEIIRLLTSHQSLSTDFKNKICNGQFALAKDLLLQWETFDQSILTDRALKTNFTEFVFDVVRKNETDLVRTLIEKSGAKFFDLQDEDKTTALMVACQRGNTEIANLLIEKSKSNSENYTNFADEYGNTALYLASHYGHVDVVKLLLERGARVDIQNTDRDTALIVASHRGHVDVVRLLLTAGARVNIQNTNRNTALIFASYQGHVEVVKLLLDKGAKVDDKNEHDDTALILASYRGRVEVVKALLIAGADTEIENNLGQTALNIATQVGRAEIINLLTDHTTSRSFKDMIRSWQYKSDEQFESARSLLLQWKTFDQSILTDSELKTKFTELVFDAVKNNKTDLARTLIEKLGAKFFDLQDENEATALMVASQNGHVDVVKLLLDRGAGVDIQNYDLDTALIVASFYGHAEVVKLLLDRGVGANIQNTNRDTALIAASYQDHVEVVKLLLNKGANVNIKNNMGITALILASYQGHAEVVKALLIAGADTEIENNLGQTALNIATRYERTEIINLLTDHTISRSFKDMIRSWQYESDEKFKSAKDLLSQWKTFDQSILADSELKTKFTEFVFDAVRNNKTDLVTTLIKKLGADFFDITNGKNTIIEHALLNYNQEKRELIEILLGEFKKLKQTQIVDEATGYTPFHYLRYCGDQKEDTINSLVEILVNLGYDINAKSSSGKTVLHYVVSKFSSNSSKIIESLIQKGVKVDEKAILSGDTALHMAVQEGNLEAIETLLKNKADHNVENKVNHTPLKLAESKGNYNKIKKIFDKYVPSVDPANPESPRGIVDNGRERP